MDKIKVKYMLDYGIIGNCVTAALVKKNASIDWMCFPDFSSPSIFAKLLDSEKGGSFEIWAPEEFTCRQSYIHRTAVLETVFSSADSEFIVYDFFPRYNVLLQGKKRKLVKENRLVRIIKPIKGKPSIRVIYNPRPGYAESNVSCSINGETINCSSGQERIVLHTNMDRESVLSGRKVRLTAPLFFILSVNGMDAMPNMSLCSKLLNDTVRYWQKWSSTLVTPENRREMIIRSAITLKLLTYSETGAIIAAATTSIPEETKSDRNFDYRFCWLRDAALCADALKKVGREYEPKRLMEFVMQRVTNDDNIQPLYGIRGEYQLTEKELHHLSGFGGWGPVRTGNAAFDQRQNDIFGEIIDIIYLYFVYYELEKTLPPKYWRLVTYLVNQIRFNWKRRDSSIWEYRGLLDHYTYSKLMCYVGVDRAIKIAQHFSKESRISGWLELRDEIMSDIIQNCYNKALGTFTMSPGNDNLDASLLLMAYHEFLPPDDPRLIGTVRAIYRSLRKGYRVKRYSSRDDYGETNHYFTICSLWLADALYYIGETSKARRIFTQILMKANHLGLFSETIDSRGRMLGNFPQAYTHIALINSSILMSEWNSKRKKIEWKSSPGIRRWF